MQSDDEPPRGAPIRYRSVPTERLSRYRGTCTAAGFETRRSRRFGASTFPKVQEPPTGGLGIAERRGRSPRHERIARLLEAMTWPPTTERWRLDGEVRRHTSPILAELVSAVGRLKAVLAGLADDPRPIALDERTEDEAIRPSAELAAFRPGRVVALREVEDEELRAPTNPFSGLAERALDLVIPELEVSLTELTVLLNEYLFHQEHRLEELLDTSPGELLIALEESMPTWADDAAARQAELARLWRHLLRPEPSTPPNDERADDDGADIRR